MPKIVSNSPVFDALIKAGIADDNTRRVVIDIDVKNVVPIVYVEKYGDDKLIQVAEAVGTVEITKA